jgi:hypothetical protein
MRRGFAPKRTATQSGLRKEMKQGEDTSAKVVNHSSFSGNVDQASGIIAD